MAWKFWEWQTEDEKHQQDASDFTQRAQDLINKANASRFLSDAQGALAQASEAAGGVFGRARDAAMGEFQHNQVPETYGAAKGYEASGDTGAMVQKSVETGGRIAMSVPGAATQSIDSLLGEVGLSRDKLGLPNPLQNVGLAEKGAKLGIADFAMAGAPFATKAAGAVGKIAEAGNALQNVGFAGSAVTDPVNTALGVAALGGIGASVKGLAGLRKPVVPEGTETLAGKYQSGLKGINTGVEFLLQEHVDRPPFPDSRTKEISEHVKVLTDELDGATYNVFTGSKNGQSEFAVSIFPERHLEIEGKPSVNQIQDFIETNKNLLRDPRVSVGTWFTDGKTSMDLTLTVPDEQMAHELGKHFNQIAIWDLKNATEIPTGGTGGLKTLDIWGKDNKWYVGTRKGSGDLEHQTVEIGPGGLIALDDVGTHSNQELERAGYKGIYYPDDRVHMFTEPKAEKKESMLIGLGAKLFGGETKQIVPPNEVDTLAPPSPITKAKFEDTYGKDVMTSIDSLPYSKWTDKGLSLKLSRFQRPQVAGKESSRGGIFYEPEGKTSYMTASDDSANTGGSQQISGETVFKNPLFVKGEVYEAMTTLGGRDENELVDLIYTMRSHNYGTSNEAREQLVSKYGLIRQDLDRIAENVPYDEQTWAVKELYASKLAREHGHDAIISIIPSAIGETSDMWYQLDALANSKKLAEEYDKDGQGGLANNYFSAAWAKAQDLMSKGQEDFTSKSAEEVEKARDALTGGVTYNIGEVFDIRESSYPTPQGDWSVFDVFKPVGNALQQVPASVYRSGAQGAIAGGTEGFNQAQQDDANPYQTAMMTIAGAAVGATEKVAMKGALNKLNQAGVSDEVIKSFNYQILKNGPKIHHDGNWLEKSMYTALLSGPKTFVSQAISVIPEVSMKLMRDAVGSVGHPDRLAADFVGLFHGLAQAGQASADTLLHLGDKGLFGVPGQAIEGIDLASRATIFGMHVGYNAAKDAEKMGLSVQARSKYVADALADPVGTGYFDKANAGANRATYMPVESGGHLTETGFTGELIAGLQKQPIFRWFLPFVSTVHRMAARGVEMSPLGLLGTGFDVARGVYDPNRATTFKGLGDLKNVNADLKERLGNNLVGSALFTYFVLKSYGEGSITANGPADQSHKAALVRQGWQPYSIKGPDGKWYDYRKFGVAAELLAMAAGTAEVLKYGKDEETRWKQGAAAFSGVLDEMTYARGITDLIRAFNEPSEGTFNALLASGARRLIPYSALLNTIANAVDPTMRETHGIVDTLQSEIPGLRNKLPESLDTFGQPRPNAVSGLGSVAPTRVSVEHEDRINSELIRHDLPAGKVNDTIQMPDGTERKLTNPEIHQYQLVAGEGKRVALSAVINSDAYKKADDKAQKTMLRTVMLHAASWGKEAVVPEAVKDSELGRYGGDPAATANGLVKALVTKQDLEKLAANKYAGKDIKEALIIDDDKQTLAAYKMAMGEALGDQAFISKYGYLKYTQAKFIKPVKHYSDARKKMLTDNPEYNKFFGSSLDPSEVQSTRTLIPAQ